MNVRRIAVSLSASCECCALARIHARPRSVWLDFGDIAAREKITVLNLRHTLSTALVAARAAGLGHWKPGLNVNQLLARELGSEFAWLAHPVFTALLGDQDAP
jgi:hypothetical protein